MGDTAKSRFEVIDEPFATRLRRGDSFAVVADQPGHACVLARKSCNCKFEILGVAIKHHRRAPARIIDKAGLEPHLKYTGVTRKVVGELREPVPT